MTTTTTEIAASPAKLNTGAWGAKVQGRVEVGQALRITTRAGKSWTATVERVVWTDGKVSLVSTRSADRKPTSKASSSGCRHCCRTATRTAQIWEDCDYCGSPVVYM
jgi:hypothetical protein